MLPTSSSNGEADPLFKKLTESPLFQTYKTAFQAATGLHLYLLPPGLSEYDRQNGMQSQFRNPFCDELSRIAKAKQYEVCSCCHSSTEKLLEPAPGTFTCKAGLTETAVPVRNGDQTIAVLTTGYVFVGDQTPELKSQVARRLDEIAITPAQRATLLELWDQCPTVESQKYNGIVTILTSFAVQLSVHVNRIALENSNTEPWLVQQAKQYVTSHIDKKITLAEVADHVGVSTFYFCKVFKRASGMTLTEYINRRRIEIAKLKLLNPEARVIEIAYETGFQSLSQFNRSFRRYAGKSPTSYRKSQSYAKTNK